LSTRIRSAPRRLRLRGFYGDAGVISARSQGATSRAGWERSSAARGRL
jgi:hypothetical protein